MPSVIAGGTYGAEVIEQLERRGWRTHNEGGSLADLAVFWAASAEDRASSEDGRYAPCLNEAVDTIALTVDFLNAAHGVLRDGGLALVIVDHPVTRTASTRPAGAVVAATLATVTGLLAAEWADCGATRCLLACAAQHNPGHVAELANWLAADGAPPMTGQVIDLAGAKHVALRPPSS